MALPFPHPSALLPPGFTMSRATPEDTEGMTDVCKFYFRAFSAVPEFTYWWSTPAAMRAWNADRVRARFTDPRVQQFKVAEEGTGRVVAFAKWDVPATVTGLRGGFVMYDEKGKVVVGGAEKEDGGGEKGGDGVGDAGEVKKHGLKAPEGVDQVLFDEMFGGLMRMQEKWRTSEKLVLSIICTDPSYHGRGIGAALIQSVLAVADAEQVPVYLEAMPLALPLYQRHGFAQVDTLEFDGGKDGNEQKPTLAIMVREPKPVV
ncbi:acyl-CoA N-acyltransferase [Annulohypoxylon truncatum]|uniref:acyl-CoA N-acyltransferase n=1 Tax=Annulohypoxylon truncatum TaxID=327061 RepID=UPI002007AE2E|nr:acyl-CoA N-acyltransferase [Annulohypoxylon truncatum]KAI1214120.1 acyl-CoA N-acyltransferase [Annulohypoxylon truncatum]